MISEPFLKPRLIGTRFEGGVIPLEILADFAVLEEMIVEVAKWKFREAHPDRKRVSRGFSDGITLKLTGIEDGSARPIIKLFIAASMLFPPSAQTYFQDARDAIIGAIGAAEQSKPIAAILPQRMLGYFDRFGRHLNEGEIIEFDEGQDRVPVRLTKETRRTLILASSAEEFTEETSIDGLVHEFDQRAKTFQLTLGDGTILSRIPVESQHYDTVLEASHGFRDKLRVRVSGIGRFDRNNRLREIDKVEHITILDPLDIHVRIDEFKLLAAGWLDGQGIPPTHEGLDWLSEAFDGNFPDDLALPYLFPTPEGQVLAEWSLKSWAPSLEIDLGKKQGEWNALNLDTDDEDTRELNLANADDWKWLVQQIRNLGGEAE